MKIAHVVCTFPPYRGGIGNSAYNFARLAAERGLSVTVFTPLYPRSGSSATGLRTGTEFDGQDKPQAKISVDRLVPLLRYGNAAVLPQLFWKLTKFDLVHLHYPFYGVGLIVLLYKLFSGRKFKYLIHYHMDPTARGLKGAFFRLDRRLILPQLLKRAEFVTCASVDYAKNSALTRYYDRQPKKFINLPFGVDLDFFKSDPSIRKVAGQKTILFVGGLDRAHYFKGVKVLLNALKLLADEYAADAEDGPIDLRLKIVGTGDMLSDYAATAKDLGIASRVEFAGGVDDAELAACYNRADLLVLPSTNKGEAFGLVLLEAMAAGKPVVATNLPGVRSVFKNGVEGLIAAPGDAKDLKNKIKAILTDDERARQMGQAARSLVEKKYDWNYVGDALVRLYYRANFTP